VTGREYATLDHAIMPVQAAATGSISNLTKALKETFG
jgi:hypothetical protein